jgi:hypothetical protein
MQPGATERRRVLRELEQQRLIPCPDLAQIERVHQARSLDDLRQRGALLRGQGRQVGLDLGGGEPAGDALEGSHVHGHGEQGSEQNHGARLPGR